LSYAPAKGKQKVRKEFREVNGQRQDLRFPIDD